RAGGFGQRFDIGVCLVHHAQLARIVAEAQESRVEQATVHVLDVERVEALRPERPAARRLDDDAPARARVARMPALRAPRDHGGRALPRRAVDRRRLAGFETTAARIARARIESGPEQRVEVVRVVFLERRLPAGAEPVEATTDG